MKKYKKRIYDIIQIGNRNDIPSTAFDIFIVVMIFLNLFVTFADTFDECEPLYGLFDVVELITIIVFTIEYLLRIWTAEYAYPRKKKYKSILCYMLSFYGLIDLFTIFPYFLPYVVPSGIVAFRILRVFRIFRLFKINAQYDAFNVITDVLYEKKNQLFSSMCLILMLMIASSLGMYGLEHNAQPETFKNAFSGIWWATSTLLTVGYGDIYPVTYAGRVLAIFISFLGVGMVAVPTGIISAGFVEQYTKIKTMMTKGTEKDVQFIASVLDEKHVWNGKKVRDIVLPPQILLVVVNRGEENIVPSGTTVLQTGDVLILAGKHYDGHEELNLSVHKIGREHDWEGLKIKDLDISRQELIVSIERNGKLVIPNGSTVIRKDDQVLVYRRSVKER